MLDSDYDDMISREKIDVMNIREEIVILIAPILIEMVNDNKPLSRSEFI